MTITLKWRVAEKSTGQYRSFYRRGWPTASLSDGRIAFMLRCDDEYVPALVKEGRHAEIRIHVAMWRERAGDHPTFDWRRMSDPVATLQEAKDLCAKFVAAHPNFFDPWSRPVGGP